MEKQYSRGEEIANTVTHLLGAGLAMAAIALLVIRGARYGNYKHIVGFSIFGVSTLILYSMSSVYHMLEPNTKARRVFKILDHSAIYVLISGTYTPYILTVLNGTAALILFISQWGLTTLGILFKVKFAGKMKLFSTLIYLFMGWMIIFFFRPLKESLNPLALNLLIASGITYSVGTIFYMMKNVRFTHAIWHLFVLGGSILAFLSVFYSVN